MSKTAQALRDTVAAAVVSMVAISFYISAAALLFQGPLAEHLAAGIGGALGGAALLALMAAFTLSIPLASVGPEPATVPVLAAMTAAISAQCSAASVFPTALVALALATSCIGAAWLALGRLRAGELIRYIPYPVIGGFLAGIGWLMLSGGLGVVLGQSFSLTLLAQTFTHAPSAPLLAGCGVALALWWTTQRLRHVLVMPAVIVLSILLIHGWLAAQGLSLEAARSQGWLMREFAQAVPAMPLANEQLSKVDWGVLWHEAGALLSAVIVSTIALLLSDSSLEVAFEERADFNRDLTTLGLANIALGALGGLVGGISISRSVLNKEAGAASRWSGAVKGAICLGAMVLGGPVIALIPKAVLGGILMFLGLGMLKTWLFDGRKRLSRNDYVAVLAMVALTVFVGYLPAVVLGVVVCCFDFAVASSRLGPLRRTFCRNEWPGKVERSAAQGQVLEAAGSRLRFVELQGPLFFGSIRTLAGDIEASVQSAQALEQLVIDFRRVTWLDSSAAQALSRVLKVLVRARIQAGFSGVSGDLRRVLEQNGCLQAGGPDCYGDIDQAIAQWEDRVLAQANVSQHPLEDWLAVELGSAPAVQQLLGYLETLHLEAGATLCEQGAVADSLYLVQQGRLGASITAQGKQFRVRSIQAGGTVGEMGLYRATPRSATVQAETNSVVLRMTRGKLQEIEAQAPELALALHRMFVRLLASRLAHANAQTTALAL